MKLTKELLEILYVKGRLSARHIARMFGLHHSTVLDKLYRYGIEVRSDQRQPVEGDGEYASVRLESDEVPFSNVEATPRSSVLVPLPIAGSREASLTLVISDLHIGDANHLPETYWSCIANAELVIRHIASSYDVKNLSIVLNGDIVAGQNVFHEQELRNLLARGHWQVFVAEYIVRSTIQRLSKVIPVSSIYYVKGNHEGLANNFVLYLKRSIGSKGKYLSHGGLVNIADPIVTYLVYFTHGYGRSSYSPVSPRLLRDCMELLEKYRARNVFVDRICVGHSHWLTTNLYLGGKLWDVTGGFQKWELSVSNRPCGLILYMFNSNDVSAIPIRPDPRVESSELSDPGLEYKNLEYYGRILLKHLAEVEEVDAYEEA